MLKAALFCVALVGTFGATLAVAQARQVLIWNQYYTVDDDPIVAPAPPKFNALTAHPERYDDVGRREIELEPAK